MDGVHLNKLLHLTHKQSLWLINLHYPLCTSATCRAEQSWNESVSFESICQSQAWITEEGFLFYLVYNLLFILPWKIKFEFGNGVIEWHVLLVQPIAIFLRSLQHCQECNLFEDYLKKCTVM